MLRNAERMLHAAHVTKGVIENDRALEVLALQGQAQFICGLPCPQWLQHLRRALYLEDRIEAAKVFNQGKHRVAKRLIAKAHNAILAGRREVDVSSLDFTVVSRYY